MASTSFRCFLLCLLVIVNGCAESTNTQRLLQMASGPSAAEAPTKANPYYDYLMAQHYIRASQVDQAIAAYNRALDNDPRSVVLLTELGSLYVRQGKIDAALRLIEEATALKPDYEPGIMMLGQLYAASGQNSKAISSYKRVMEMNPANGDIYLLLGTLYAQEGRFAEAMETFENIPKIRNKLQT
ncbi:MAG TPA: tetratricopeptide repeat protein, partial [Syntrophobacteraceae bacterium]|nr:tetratricopeptide repeat protein [Syntrophobacteraceae bacterium]